MYFFDIVCRLTIVIGYEKTLLTTQRGLTKSHECRTYPRKWLHMARCHVITV